MCTNTIPSQALFTFIYCFFPKPIKKKHCSSNYYTSNDLLSLSTRDTAIPTVVVPNAISTT